MTDSILNSVKKVLGLDADYTAFDEDVIMHINTAFSVLHQVGASPSEGLTILDETATWSDFIQNVQHVNMVKTYVYLKVKLLFDPPTSSYALTAMEKQADQLEWRLNVLEFTFNPPIVEEV